MSNVPMALQEESREMPDGTRRVVTPPILALARVSVIRGEGFVSVFLSCCVSLLPCFPFHPWTVFDCLSSPLEGVPFIDDYIRTPEPVQDFLTRFSGLQHGDLDPNMSSHFVTSLKVSQRPVHFPSPLLFACPCFPHQMWTTTS